jgi:hypothetical protein
MVQRRKRKYLLTNSPFFDRKEISTKSKLEPLSYNEKEDYYITKRIIYKSEEYVKAVVENNINITEYYELSNLAKTILFYIINVRLQYNSLTFELDVSIVARTLQMKSKSKIYEAIKELIEHKYIAKTDIKQVYWINHNKYYKGNYLVIKSIESK